MSDTKFKPVWSGDEQPATQVKNSYDKLLEPMSKDFDIGIELVVCHGKKDQMPEMDFEKFYIFAMMAPDIINTKPGKIEKIKLSNKEFKIEGGQQDILTINGDITKEATVIKDENGIDLAIIYDSALYILNDFVHCAKKEQLDTSVELFKYIIDRATETDDLYKALRAGPEEKGRRSLEHAISKQFKNRLKKELVALSSSQALYDKYITNFTDAHRKIISTEAIIIAIKSNLESIPAALEKKWNSVKRLEGSKMYEKISFQRNFVKGTTTPLFIKYGSKYYQMGRYDIILNFDGNISIHSVDNLGDEKAYDHPHVSSGRPCWGNLSGEPQKRVAESEFDVAFVEIYTYLCSYSKEGGPHRTIDHWPTVNKAEAEGKSEEKETKKEETTVS